MTELLLLVQSVLQPNKVALVLRQPSCVTVTKTITFPPRAHTYKHTIAGKHRHLFMSSRPRGQSRLSFGALMSNSASFHPHWFTRRVPAERPPAPPSRHLASPLRNGQPLFPPSIPFRFVTRSCIRCHSPLMALDRPDQCVSLTCGEVGAVNKMTLLLPACYTGRIGNYADSEHGTASRVFGGTLFLVHTCAMSWRPKRGANCLWICLLSFYRPNVLYWQKCRLSLRCQTSACYEIKQQPLAHRPPQLHACTHIQIRYATVLLCCTGIPKHLVCRCSFLGGKVHIKRY